MQPLRWGSNFEVPANAGIPEVLQYADWYIAGRGDREQQHRYKRCLGRLKGYSISDRRIVNVDIGCGTGLFSWAFLDWATERGLEFDQLGLYGLDRCRAMLNVAEMARAKLSRLIANYPNLRYHLNADELLQQLTEDHLEGSYYFVTFGYVLIQVWENTPQSIGDFAKAISHIVRLPGSRCSVLEVDAYSGNRPAQLAAAKESLRDHLTATGINWD